MRRVYLARLLSLICYLGLIAFGMAWAIWLGQLPREEISLTLLILVAPLLVPLRGILHARDKALVWGMLVAMIPLLHGGMTLWAEQGPQKVWGWVEFLLAIGYIVSGSFFIRWRAQREHR
ncbi:MAG: DUF2069 domain-containing protein [Gammaproteobacteria bacterium]|nr:MAG: DUF2069 domain-containing protein [Gammaproteobacteria bacterium]